MSSSDDAVPTKAPTALRQYALFLFNGGMLGLLTWALQQGIYHLIDSGQQRDYALASALACAPVILLNCSIQRRLIFRQHGPFRRFLLANLFMMFFVSALAPLCRSLVDLGWHGGHGETLGFAVASLIGSVPSFLINKFWVFKPANR
ncbi:GtrA family protein [Herbaspirillum seropedicae]|uniref:GtrA family protein n=1 Tax=Herbaspirillum seropedicae TaxID=964 RepID=UPI00285E9FA9|nr:GtrA family protein [Herbaspirillum seropedicae]MDR6395955.1 putative flippase GtrA [Herbaspirillum seropedicae]